MLVENDHLSKGIPKLMNTFYKGKAFYAGLKDLLKIVSPPPPSIKLPFSTWGY
jgi:hypothetical protein